MKINRILSATLIAVALSGCSQDEQLFQTIETNRVFTGNFENVASRVALGEDLSMNWENGDLVSIFPKYNVNNQYKVQSINDGLATFEFVDYIDVENLVSATANYAVYPYYSSNSLSGDVITSTVPAVIEYDGMANSIKNSLMVAKSTSNSLPFTNAQGILRLCLNADQPFIYGKIMSIKFESESNYLSGTATMTYTTDVTAPEAVIVDGGNRSLNINLDAALQQNLPNSKSGFAEYYIPMVPTEFLADDMTMTITWENGDTYVKKIGIDFEIKRCQIYKLSHTIGSNKYEGVFDEVIEWDGETTTIPELVTDEVTGEEYYSINTASDLAGLAALLNGTTTYSLRNVTGPINVKLTNNINLNNMQWTPISHMANAFTGTFDGNGYTISNLKYHSTEDDWYVGLFGGSKDATFKNLTIENVDINCAKGLHFAALVGDAAGTTVIENVTIKGNVKIEGDVTNVEVGRIGAVVGGNNGVFTLTNVKVEANEGSYVKGNSSIGGIAGQLQGSAIFENVYSNIDVTADRFFVGGIIGLAPTSTSFYNCSAEGDVTLLAGTGENSPYRLGGIAGCWSGGAINLTGCSYSGKLTSGDVDAFDCEGFVGRSYSAKKGDKVIIDGEVYEYQGDGIYTVDGIYEMNTFADMQWLATMVNSGENYFTGVTIKLANDIDLKNEEWTPIGSATKDHGFMGNFDGNDKTIKNLNISNIALDSDGYAYAGLFGVTEGTEQNHNYIKNLTIENVNISTEGHIVAAAIAYPYYTTVENITVKGNINIKGGDYTSGVLAYTRRCVDAMNLTIEGNAGSSIEGKITIGGVISDIQMNGGLTANYSNFAASGLTIKGEQSVGGISGIISQQKLDGATVKNVNIVCNDNRTGIVSGADGGKSTITNVSYENVTGATRVIGATWKDGYYVGQIVEAAGQKAIIYTIEDGIKAVSVEELNLKGKIWQDAITWADELGEGWSLASMEELNTIYDARVALNKELKANDENNALFWEGDELYIKNGSVYYALYISSTEAPAGEKDANGNDYFANRVFFKIFNKIGYSDVLYSAFDCINKTAPLKDNYFARGVITIK